MEWAHRGGFGAARAVGAVRGTRHVPRVGNSVGLEARLWLESVWAVWKFWVVRILGVWEAHGIENFTD